MRTELCVEASAQRIGWKELEASLDLMMKNHRIVSAFIILSIFASTANAHWEEHDLHGQYLFGYAGIGYTNDQGIASLRLSEIEGNRIPTNVQSIEVNTAADNLSSRIQELRAYDQRATIILDNLLFRNVPTLNTPCGEFAWRHRLDFQAKFDNWLALNSAYINSDNVAVLVVNTEVNNRCISPASLDLVTKYVNSKLPDIPPVAGYGRSSGAAPLPESVPASLAGVAFFKYRTFDPTTDATYQAEYNELKSKLTPEQRIILVPDGFYDSGHAALGWPKWYLGYSALNYMQLALHDAKVVGIVVFLWFGFDDASGRVLGTRDLPQGVRDKHRQVGCGLNIQSPLSIHCD